MEETMDCKRILLEQLASDMGCTPQQVASADHVFTCAKKAEGARTCHWHESSKLNVVCIHSKMMARSEDPQIIGWLQETYQNFHGEWLADFWNLRKFDEGLKAFGICVGNMTLFYLPNQAVPSLAPEIPGDMQLVWYEGQELQRFRGDERFGNALVFDDAAPDRIALTAQKGGEIVAMAAANADSERMWQMGIDVLPGFRGHAIGAALVALLKDRILGMGILPYYGTAASHIRSQMTAHRAGFVPGWLEFSTMPVEKLQQN